MRCFVAIPLAAGLQREMMLVQAGLALPRPVPPGNLHLTLVFLGDVGGETLEELDRRLAAIRSPAFTMELRGAGLFGGRRPRSVHAGVRETPALMALREKVAQAAKAAGAAPAHRRFVPHVTLARLKPGEVSLPVLERAIAGRANVLWGRQEVSEFILFRAHLGKAGAAYEALREYPLSPA